MVVGVKVPPIAQLLSGIGHVGVSGFDTSFCGKLNSGT